VAREGKGAQVKESLAKEGLADDCAGISKVKESSGGWDRTSDTRL